MPDTLSGWLWFVFFTVGSLGGWVMAGLAVTMVVQEFRYRRFMSKAKK